MISLVERLRKNLEARGEYVVKANISSGWFAVFPSTWSTRTKAAQHDGREGPNLVVYRTNSPNPRDHHVIPYSMVRNLLTEDTLTHSRVNGSQRWNLTLKDGGLRVTHRPGKVDVSQYHEAPLILESTSPTSVPEENGRFGVVRGKIESILRNPVVRPTQLSIFADSLSFIYEQNPQALLTHLLSDRLRLFAGRLIVLTLQDESVWLPVEPTDRAARLAELKSWEWDTTSYPEYRRQPSRNGYYKPSLDKHQPPFRSEAISGMAEGRYSQ